MFYLFICIRVEDTCDQRKQNTNQCILASSTTEFSEMLMLFESVT